MRILFLLFLSCIQSLAQTYAVRIPTNAPATGDLIIWSGSAWVPLARGTNGQVLTATASSITWSNAAAGGGSGTVTSIGLSTSLSGLSVGSTPVTSSGTITLSGTLGLGSGGTGATDAPGARTALSLVPGTDVQAYDADLAAIAALANSGIIVRTGAGTVSARTITGDSEAVVSNGDGVSGNPTLSIGAAIARDSEVAAGYQPLDADLTAMAAGTAVATAQTNAVSVGAPVQYVGSTNIAQHLALKAPLASPAFTTSATIGGTNVLDYVATHLTEAEASALYQRTNAVLTSLQGLTGGTAGQIVTATGAGTFAMSNAPSGGGTWDGTPIASGTITNLTTETLIMGGYGVSEPNIWYSPNAMSWGTDYMYSQGGAHEILPFAIASIASGTSAFLASSPMGEDNTVYRVNSSASANSGVYSMTRIDHLRATTNMLFIFTVRPQATNATVIKSYIGFHDAFTVARPTDGIFWERDGDQVTLTAASNLVYTSSSAFTIASNTPYRGAIWVRQVGSDTVSQLQIRDIASKPSVVLTNLYVTNGLAINNSGRVFGSGSTCVSTNGVAVVLEDYGMMRGTIWLSR